MPNRSNIGRAIARATVVAGTFDILAAALLTLWFGRAVPVMLRYVASGPFPGAADWGAGGAVVGLIVHYALMAIMVSVFVFAATRSAALRTAPVLWGAVYGLVTYVVMNLIVVPLRFGTPLPPSTLSIFTQLFCHIVLVGIPTALITRRALG